MHELAASEFFTALRHGVANAGLYPADHPQTALAVDILAERAGALTAGTEEVVLSLVDDAFYLDKELLPQASLEFRELYTLMSRRGLDSVSIHHDATPGDLGEFAAFISSESGDLPAEGTIRLNERPYRSAELQQAATMAEVRHSYVASLDLLKGVSDSMSDDEGADIGDAIWTVEQLLESVLTQPGSSLLLSTLKTHDGYTFFHSVNTSLLALTIGRAIGLGREQLIQLGQGALLHDLGKIRVPSEIIQYPGRLDDTQWLEIQRHPQEGAQAILAGTGPGQEIAARVALEHHAGFNLGGYPQIPGRAKLHLFSRITSVCDVYDALTTRRSYKRALPPAMALRTVVEEAGTRLDPDVVQVLVSILGIFPAGSLLRLDTGEVAIVVSSRNQDQPTIVVGVLDAHGSSIDESEAHQIELDQIVGLVLPEDVGISPASLVENAHVVLDEVA